MKIEVVLEDGQDKTCIKAATWLTVQQKPRRSELEPDNISPEVINIVMPTCSTLPCQIQPLLFSLNNVVVKIFYDDGIFMCMYLKHWKCHEQLDTTGIKTSKSCQITVQVYTIQHNIYKFYFQAKVLFVWYLQSSIFMGLISKMLAVITELHCLVNKRATQVNARCSKHLGSKAHLSCMR